MFELLEQCFYNLVQNPEVQKLGPYFVGMSATGLGLFLGNLYSDNNSFLEFDRNMETEFHFQEMKQLFLRRDYFFELFNTSIVCALVLIFLFIAFVLFVSYRVNKLYKTLINQFTQRIDDIENVIESILKENELEQISSKKLRLEIEHQSTTFNDFMTNKSRELETKIADAKSLCLKAKTSVHSDLKKIQGLVDDVSATKLNILNANKTLEKTKIDVKELDEQVEEFIKSIEKKINTTNENIDKTCLCLDEQLKSQQVDVLKCNSLLLNSQVLLEAALAKFEDILLLADSDTEDANINKPPSERLVLCLKKAVGLKEFFEQQETKNEDFLSRDFTEQNEHKISTNSLLFDMLQRISTMEETVASQAPLISGNNTKIKRLETMTSQKISNLKCVSDEWITAWVSVIYGLFNSSFLNLQNQLFGIDSLEYPTIFDIASDEIQENSAIFHDIMDGCKQTCLKIIKEVNLLIFEYYLIQKSTTQTSPSLISLCNEKIDHELDELFHSMENKIFTSSIEHMRRPAILNALLKLKFDLATDLKNDTYRLNSLIKQNLEDFYIIHDTLKTIFKESPNHFNMNDDDSIIEFSEHSTSLLSSYDESSFSENDSLIEMVNGASLRSFKLVGNKN